MAIKCRIFVCAIALLYSACAPLAPIHERQTFIPRQELAVVSLVRKGLDFYKKGQLIEAELSLRKAHYIAPMAERVRLNLAVVLEQQGLYEEAIKLLEDLVREYPKSVRHISALAHAYFDAARYRDALDMYERALAMSFDSVVAIKIRNTLQTLSVLNFRLGNDEQAVCYSDVKPYGIEDNLTVRYQARMLIANGFYDKAVVVLEDFIGNAAQGTADPNVLLQLALAHFAHKRWKDVASVLERVKERKRLLDTTSIYELTLIEKLLQRMEENKKEKNPAVQEQQLDEEEMAEKNGIFLSNPLENPLSLYWPVNMLKMLDAVRTELAVLKEEQ